MPDNRPRPPDRQRTLIAPLIIGGVVVVLMLSALFLQGDHKEAPPRPPPVVVATPPTLPTPAVLPAPPPPLGRRDLIEIANLQAANYASGAAPDPAGKALIGRRFTLRVPFGCEGPQTGASAAQAYFQYDPVKATIKLLARPGDWTALPMLQAAGDSDKIEKVEGFWVPRPWSFSETCPPRHDLPTPATPTAAAPPSFGLARIFKADSSRLLRRDGRAYEFVLKVPEDDRAPQAASYRLVIEGRVSGFDTGQPARCWSETADHRPICVVAVEFDRVAFEDASGKPLAEWHD